GVAGLRFVAVVNAVRLAPTKLPRNVGTLPGMKMGCVVATWADARSDAPPMASAASAATVNSRLEFMSPSCEMQSPGIPRLVRHATLEQSGNPQSATDCDAIHCVDRDWLLSSESWGIREFVSPMRPDFWPEAGRCRLPNFTLPTDSMRLRTTAFRPGKWGKPF